jgi:hypothetical protein
MRVGWLDGDDLFLEPEASYATAQELAREQGEGLPVSARTLHRRLKERGLLANWDDRRKRTTVRRALEGVQLREVLHLPAAALSPCTEPSTPSTAARPESANGQLVDGPVDGSVDGREARLPEPSTGPSTETVHQHGQPHTEQPSGGRCGRSDTGGGSRPEEKDWDEV